MTTQAVTPAVLVTGAAGFAGSHLLDRLCAGGRSVVAWHRLGRPAPGKGPAVVWDAVDVLDRDQVRAAVVRVKPSIVFHCAGTAHVGRSWDTIASTFATNVLGTHHLLEAVRLAGLESRVVIPSSAMVYAASDHPMAEDHRLQPASPYGLSKLAQEMLGLRAFSDNRQRVMIARAFNHVGSRQHELFAASTFARQIARIEAGLAEPQLFVGNVDAQRDLTDVRDTVDAYQTIGERARPGSVYNVCSGVAVSLRTVLNRLVANARVPVAVRIDPALFRPNDTRLIVGDNTRLRTELGWSPRYSLDETLRYLLDYWRGRTGAEQT